jgi:predicted SAM-dependent methyltransferase
MKLLNVGCGFPRFPEPFWTNLDNLHAHLIPGRRERDALDEETNYVNHDIATGPMPFPDGTFNGVLLSHVLEHFDIGPGVELLRDCRRLLVNGGVLMVAVPDCSYFRRVYPEDRNENWKTLFGVVDHRNPIPTFFEAALWFAEHRAMHTEDTVWSYLVRSGFDSREVSRHAKGETCGRDEIARLDEKLNRVPFSLFMRAVKT